MNGRPCGGQHSSTVCGSGSVYCGVAKAFVYKGLNTVNSSSSQGPPADSSSNGCLLDIDAVTLLPLQDVNVLDGSPARVCWDNGSNRALITHQYALDNKLRSQKIAFRLAIVGSKGCA